MHCRVEAAVGASMGLFNDPEASSLTSTLQQQGRWGGLQNNSYLAFRVFTVERRGRYVHWFSCQIWICCGPDLLLYL